MRMKVLLLFLSSLLFLAGCALFVPIVWTDSSDIPQDYGIAFVEITLKGRDSASVFIDDGAARSNKKLILKVLNKKVCEYKLACYKKLISFAKCNRRNIGTKIKAHTAGFTIKTLYRKFICRIKMKAYIKCEKTY